MALMCWIIFRLYFFLTIVLLVGAWKCQSFSCLRKPLKLRLLHKEIEVGSKSYRVTSGSRVSITCDGSCVGSSVDPLLRWYGPDRYWIDDNSQRSRVRVSSSFSKRFLKLTIRHVTPSDSGDYICRGWLGPDKGWDMKHIRIVVAPPKGKLKTTPEIPRERTIFINTFTPTYRTTTRIQRTTTPIRRQTTPILQRTTTPIRRTTTHARRTTATTLPRAETVTTQGTTSTSLKTASTTNVTKPETDDACSAPFIHCGSGECIGGSLKCDNFPDCDDGSDELGCATIVCSENLVTCRDGKTCIEPSRMCDDNIDCRDKSDEDPEVCG